LILGMPQTSLPYCAVLLPAGLLSLGHGYDGVGSTRPATSRPMARMASTVTSM
jgi:hypothetical protein